MTPSDYKKYGSFYAYLRALRKDFPTGMPVEVRTRKKNTLKLNGRRVHGLTTFWEGNLGALIQIERNSDVEEMVNHVWHEWTHVYHGIPCRKEHPLEWWKTHGRIVNFYTDEQKDDDQ